MPPAQKCYYLTRRGTKALTKGRIGAWHPVLTQKDLTQEVTLLDCFDQSLRRSNRLLLESGGAFELLSADGTALTQSAARTGDFVAQFAEGPVKSALADLSPLRRLGPLGKGSLRRASLRWLDNAQKARCHADLQMFTMGDDRSGAIVTLQDLPGDDRALSDLRRLVLSCGGSSISQGRLHADLFPQCPLYEPKPDIAIAPDDSAFDAATRIIAAHIPAMCANEAGIVADHDTEFLHDYRVALRKIRIILGLFKGIYRKDQTKLLRIRFSALMRATGPLRDLDVALLERAPFRALLPPALHDGLDGLFAIFAQQREAERNILAQYLTSDAYRDEIRSLGKMFDKRNRLHPGRLADRPVRGYACRLILDRFARVRTPALAVGPDTADTALHALRVDVKKLRYLMEVFSPLFPGQALRALLEPLKSAQDILGHFNDCAVQKAHLHAVLTTAQAGATPDVAQSVGALIAVLHGKQSACRAEISGALAEFCSAQTEQGFRQLFQMRKGAT